MYFTLFFFPDLWYSDSDCCQSLTDKEKDIMKSTFQKLSSLRRGAGEKYRLSDWAWMMAGASFLGFVVEDIWLMIVRGYINNRNMYLPFLLGYGLAVFGVWLFFGTPMDTCGIIRAPEAFTGWKRAACYIFYVFVFVCLAEIILGYSVRQSCEIDYWNYENLPLHITRYTSVFTSLGFSAIISLFMHFVFGRVMSWISRHRSPLSEKVGIALLAVLVIDYFLSFGYMVVNNSFHLVWKIIIR